MNQKILKMMGFKPSSHNEIYLDHLETITDFLIEHCPIDQKRALSMLRGSTGISIRYVKEHIDSLLAWGIIKKEKGEYLWTLEGVQPIRIKIEGKNEDVPDHFSGNVRMEAKEIKPCKYRPAVGECNPLPGVSVLPSSEICNMCTQREA